MIKALKLDESATIKDLIPNNIYVAQIDNSYLVLNDNIKIKSAITKEGFFPVKITRINLPNQVQVQILDEEFTAISEDTQKIKFWLDNPVLNKLEKRIGIAVRKILNAAEKGQPIIIRHHADCDGYSAALCLEEVLLPIISKATDKVWQNYRRLPMRTPFYEYTDALKDLSTLKDHKKYGKNPLLILVDNGCGQEDILSLKRIKESEVEIIVIDHHNYDKEVEEIADVHINGKVFGGDGSLTAGILCYEIALQIGKPNPVFPAVASVADHSNIKDYQELVDDDLVDMAKCIDFECNQLKYLENDLIKDVYFNKNVRAIISQEIEKLTNAILPVIDKYIEVKDNVGKLDLDKTTLRGDYPNPGKIVGIAHRRHNTKLTIGFASNFLTFRYDGDKFSLPNAMNNLKTKFPYANIQGGGHDNAGTLKFVSAAKEEVIEEFLSMFKLSMFKDTFK